MKENQISVLLITGLLALLGTVAGGVVQGYWNTQMAQQDFQSKLILRALEPDDVTERLKSLEFLIAAKLLSDPEVEEGLKSIIAKGEDSIPQFQPENAIPQNSSGGNFTPSAKPADLKLKNGIAPLVGLKVRHGDVIDAITPIFAELAPDLSIKNKVVGETFGGAGGVETLLEQDGYIITGIDVYSGEYFGNVEVIQIQIIWHKLTPSGIDSNDEIISEKLGSGNFAGELHIRELRVEPGNYIDDFSITTYTHTDGSTFFNDISITENQLPIEN